MKINKELLWAALIPSIALTIVATVAGGYVDLKQTGLMFTVIYLISAIGLHFNVKKYLKG